MTTELPRWFDRRFTFPGGPEAHPFVRSRLRGAPARLEELTSGLHPSFLVRRYDEAWSIQENAGHLLDLEPLWAERLDQFLAGADTLRAADLTNRKTDEARHNDAVLGEILEEFREARLAFVRRLDVLSTEDFGRTALHPRLQQPLRLIDHMVFVAEHDDQHLARIWELSRRG
jgi:uncharacterized damage-inducible protein DinB